MDLIDKVQRMIDEDDSSTVYTVAVISGYLVDFENDVNAVASEIWSEKAAALQATTYDISADSASYKYSQKIENAWNLAKYYGSKRLPKSSLWTKDPIEDDSEEL